MRPEPTQRSAVDIVWQTVQQEFADLGNVEALTRLCMRLLMAILLGAVLGYEREASGASAGLRTHMLVSLGSALFVLVPLQAGMAIPDVSRVLQGIISGIGFLGAGAIIKLRDEQEIKGLTTAAGIWLTAAVGVAAGMGFEGTAVVSTVFALLIFLLERVTKRLRERNDN
ncbi:MAG TPA: MgtC/SapB family protein [Burkholderiaceae bacterium]